MKTILGNVETSVFTTQNNVNYMQSFALQDTILVARTSMEDVLLSRNVTTILNVVIDVFGKVAGPTTTIYPVEMSVCTGKGENKIHYGFVFYAALF